MPNLALARASPFTSPVNLSLQAICVATNFDRSGFQMLVPETGAVQGGYYVVKKHSVIVITEFSFRWPYSTCKLQGHRCTELRGVDRRLHLICSKIFLMICILVLYLSNFIPMRTCKVAWNSIGARASASSNQVMEVICKRDSMSFRVWYESDSCISIFDSSEWKSYTGSYWSKKYKPRACQYAMKGRKH